MKNKLPFVSIIVIAYNEEKGIEKCINSLLNQDYPKNKYEIIVVDDCSNDKTIDIVKNFPIKLIKHKKNMGRAQARNSGLNFAKGDIYISFDGDCIADKKWLTELVKPYLYKKDILGIGGKIILKNDNRLLDKFILEEGCGEPSPIYVTQAKSLFARFISYLKSKSINSNHDNVLVKVGNIMGANASFYLNDLKDIGGWDTALNSCEDTDICYRLKYKFNNKSFYLNTKSKIIHDHSLNFLNYIKRPFFRGVDVIKLYNKQNKSFPIFPFPLIILFLIIIFSVINIWFLPLSLILLPQLFYFWWPMKFFKKFKYYYLLFSYIQISLELSTILGIIRGYILNKREHNKRLKQKKK